MKLEKFSEQFQSHFVYFLAFQIADCKELSEVLCSPPLLLYFSSDLGKR